MNLTRQQERNVQKSERTDITPVTRVGENNNAFTLAVELPGVAEKDIDVTLEHRTLSVSAENTVERYADYTLTLTEIPEVRYRAAFELPERVDAAGITASNRNGLLILTLPKRKEVKPRRIAVTAG